MRLDQRPFRVGHVACIAQIFSPTAPAEWFQSRVASPGVLTHRVPTFTEITKIISSQPLKRYLAELDFRYNERVALGVTDVERTAKAIRGRRRQAAYVPATSSSATGLNARSSTFAGCFGSLIAFDRLALLGRLPAFGGLAGLADYLLLRLWWSGEGAAQRFVHAPRRFFVAVLRIDGSLVMLFIPEL